jgi:hypothetical protein
MAQKPRRWPNYALESLESAVYGLKSIDELARQILEASAQGNHTQAMICAGDIRERALDAKHSLLNARRGDYE